jgi:hypothetical protein
LRSGLKRQTLYVVVQLSLRLGIFGTKAQDVVFWLMREIRWVGNSLVGQVRARQGSGLEVRRIPFHAMPLDLWSDSETVQWGVMRLRSSKS